MVVNEIIQGIRREVTNMVSCGKSVDPTINLIFKKLKSLKMSTSKLVNLFETVRDNLHIMSTPEIKYLISILAKDDNYSIMKITKSLIEDLKRHVSKRENNQLRKGL